MQQQQTRIYSPEEESKIERLQEKIRPLDSWLRANQYTAPADRVAQHKKELLTLCLDLNDLLDQKHLKTVTHGQEV